jgi:PIN domain nuclease of toxin-antitoxin system
MKLLLDTHAFIWWDSDHTNLSPQALNLCQEPENILILSVVSVWEMQIKHQLGKLKLDLSLREIINSQQRINKIQILSVTIEHVLTLDQLPTHHKYPFDRLLIAQAQMEDALLLSKDPVFKDYPVKVVW